MIRQELEALDRDVFDANVKYLRVMAEESGAVFVDLSEDFPQEHLLDSAHLLPEGHELTAETVHERIDVIVVGIEAERTGEE